MSGTLLDVYNSNPASSMQSADIMYLIRSPYSSSTPGLGILWDNILASIRTSLSPALTTVYVDASNGSDSSGNGTSIYPYATVAHATSTITTNSSTNKYAILLMGSSSETAIALKPWVSLIGYSDNVSQITVTGSGNNVTLDPSFLTATSPSISIWNINFAGATNLLFDFTGGSATRATIGMENVNCNNLTFTGRGTTHNDEINLYGCDIGGETLITDATVFSYVTEYDDTVTVNSTNATSARTWSSNGDLIFNVVTINQTSSQNLTASFANSNIQSIIISSTSVLINYDSASYPQQGFSFSGDATAAPSLNSAYAPPLTTVSTSSYDIQFSDQTVLVNNAGAVALNLIPGNVSPTTGQFWYITDISGAAAINNITITPGNSNLINGQSSYTINTNNGSIRVVWDGNSYWVQ